MKIQIRPCDTVGNAFMVLKVGKFGYERQTRCLAFNLSPGFGLTLFSVLESKENHAHKLKP